MQVEIKTTKDQHDTGLLQKAADYVHAFILGELATRSLQIETSAVSLALLVSHGIFASCSAVCTQQRCLQCVCSSVVCSVYAAALSAFKQG